MNQEELLDYTQTIRKDLVDHIRVNHEYYTDVKLQSSVLTALKDIDTNILHQKRLKLESSRADSDKLVNQALIEFTNKYGNANPFSQKTSNTTEKEVNLPDIDTVPGQTETGIMKIEFNDIVNQFES